MEFKRGVYEMALTELARYLPRNDHRNRFLRGNVTRHRNMDDGFNHPMPAHDSPPGMELPPGASFDPDPQNDLR